MHLMRCRRGYFALCWVFAVHRMASHLMVVRPMVVFSMVMLMGRDRRGRRRCLGGHSVHAFRGQCRRKRGTLFDRRLAGQKGRCEVNADGGQGDQLRCKL